MTLNGQHFRIKTFKEGRARERGIWQMSSRHKTRKEEKSFRGRWRRRKIRQIETYQHFFTLSSTNGETRLGICLGMFTPCLNVEHQVRLNRMRVRRKTFCLYFLLLYFTFFSVKDVATGETSPSWWSSLKEMRTISGRWRVREGEGWSVETGYNLCYFFDWLQNSAFTSVVSWPILRSRKLLFLLLSGGCYDARIHSLSSG